MAVRIQNNENTTRLLNLLKVAKDQYPCLSKEEEQALIEKHKDNRDELNRLLFMHNIKAVFNQAKAFVSKTNDFDNLVQDGMLGLSEACKRFDITKNVKFITYAVPWIRKYILANFYGKQVELDKRSIAISKLVDDLSENSSNGKAPVFDNIVNDCIEPTFAVKTIDEQLSANQRTEIYNELIDELNNDSSLSADDKKMFIDVVCNKQKLAEVALKYNTSKLYINALKSKILSKFHDYLQQKYNITQYSMI